MKKETKNRKIGRGKTDIYGLKYHEMFGLRFFGSNMLCLLNSLKEAKERIWVVTVNPEFVMGAMADDRFMDIINKSDVRVIDGIGLIWAKEIQLRIKNYELRILKPLMRLWFGLKVGIEILLGKHRDSLITGADLMMKIGEEKSKKKIFFLGGWGDRAQRTAKYFDSRNKKLETRFSKGYPEVENEKVLKEINDFKPDYLFVAYGMRKQEEWIEANWDKLKARVVVGVGRSFDYYSGDLKRAPNLVRKMGLEWLYSLIKEPKRWKRQLALPKFIWMVMKW